MLKTIGISPKVWVPAVLQVIGGVVFLLLGLDVEGKTALGTGLGTFVAGFASPPGFTVVEDGTDPEA